MQFSTCVLPIFVSIGTALMFASTFSARVSAGVLFVIAGIWGAGIVVKWARGMTDWSVENKLKLGGSLAADLTITAGLLWFAFPRAEAQSAPTSQVTISGGDNVVSVGQVGGVTARSVTINLPIKPEFRILD